MRIVVLGYIVRGPLGGLAWHHLQYCIGLRALGHHVLFVEDSDDYPSCYDPSRQIVSEDSRYGLCFAQETFSQVGLGEQWAYFDKHRSVWRGPGAADAEDFCRSADVMLNLSGVNPMRSWLAAIPARAFVDTDPVFTQIRYLTDAGFRNLVDAHTRHFSFGELLNTLGSRTPRDGIDWLPTRQPVTLDQWSWDIGPEDGPFTTVMQWQSYQNRSYNNTTYGMKADSFCCVEGLPTKVAVSLEMALGGETAPRDQLSDLGWRLTDPLAVTRTISTYQAYLRRSKGEFSVAKHGYVAGHTGWFSERSAAYLAAGRPVITQDTGFSDLFEVGCGLLAFTNEKQAIEAIEQVLRDYSAHCRAARQVAEKYFDSNDVLDALIRRL